MKIFAFSDFFGSIDLLPLLKNRIELINPDVVVFTGDTVRGLARVTEWRDARKQGRIPDKQKPEIIKEIREDIKIYKEFYQMLDSIAIPSVTIPGNLDAPEGRFLTEVLNFTLKEDKVHLVQEDIVKINGFVFYGFGGEMSETEKEDYFFLRYPRSEVNFGMRKVKYLVHKSIFLFHTPPISSLDYDGGIHYGSQIVNDLIKDFKPDFVFCGHVHNGRGKEYIDKTLVINSGTLTRMQYTILDTDTKEVKFEELE